MFLQDLSNEVHWDVLLLQEFAAWSCEAPVCTAAGHSLFVSSPHAGQRRLAIVVNSSFEGTIGRKTQAERAISMEVEFCGLHLLLVNAHLYPGHKSPGAYAKSLDEVRGLAANAPQRHLVIGLDAQATVNSSFAADFPEIVGPFNDDRVDSRSPPFLRCMTELGVKLTNTFFNSELDGAWTCHYDMKFPARQIDYVGTSCDLGN